MSVAINIQNSYCMNHDCFVSGSKVIYRILLKPTCTKPKARDEGRTDAKERLWSGHKERNGRPARRY